MAETRTADATSREVPTFPVVGVGASAGGLQCFRTLLRGMGDAPGVAVVMIQHLSPDHDSMIASILARETRMPVVEAGDAMRIEKDHVYVIPPGKYLTVADHGLFLEPPTPRGGLRMPVDHFLDSLARQLGARSVAVILSGSGTDGSVGVREVKGAGGLVLAQRPDEAEYDGMPRSAIRTGHVDETLSLDEIPARIADYLAHPYVSDARAVPPHENDDAYAAITALLTAQTDYDFGSYRRATMMRRVMRRMSLRRLTDPARYLQILRAEPPELQALFADLLIGVTRFFREPPAWQVIETEVIPRLAERAIAEERPLRAWVPGCSTGEEAYTLAMLLEEAAQRSGGALDYQIFATDLNERAIARARLGCYAPNIADDVPPERLERHFHEDNGQFRLNKSIRERLVFAPHNLLRDPPFLRTDIVSCRNLLIYLEGPVQKRVIDVFAFSLREGGALLLGTSEGAGAAHRSFEPISSKWRVHRRIDTSEAPIPISPRRAPTPDWVSRAPDSGERGADRLLAAAQSALLARFAPASIVMSPDGAARYFAGPVGRILSIPAGLPTADVMAMVPDELRPRLRSAVHQVQSRRERVVLRAADVTLPEGRRPVTVEAEPVEDGDSVLVLISMRVEDEPLAPPRPAQAEGRAEEVTRDAVIAQLEDELHATRQDLQSSIAELETANEELNAANEEANSVNEEMQSANEELETSREELQSMNEELATVNAQLEDKVEEMEKVYDDLSNLLRSTDLAVLFLDGDLCIRRFTPAATALLDVIETDIGRPAAHLALAARDASLLEDARAVHGELAPRRTEVRLSGRWYARSIRPFRKAGNRIDGVVIVYFDVDEQKLALEALARRDGQSSAAIDLGQSMIVRDDIPALLEETCIVLRDTLDADFAKVLELQEDGSLRMIAGAGWPEGSADSAVPGGRDSQAGFTLWVNSPVVVDDLGSERRFSGPALLRDNAVRSGVSCLIGPRGRPFGVLGVHSRRPNRFDATDTQFLETVASLLYGAILRSDAVRELARRERLLRLAMEAAQMGAFVYDPATDRAELDTLVYALFDIDPGTEVTGKTLLERVLADDREAAWNAMLRAVEGPATFQAEFRVRRRDGSVRWIAGYGSASGEGAERRLFGVNIDISNRKEAEARERYTTRELDHRVKNVLATVSSVVTLAGHSATSLEEFRASLGSRIISLARTHTRLAESRWNGIDLRTLISDELAPYASGTVEVAISGPDVTLSPEATQTLGLAAHELTTNAAKYGAIRHGGRVAVSWEVSDRDGRPRLDFRWTESGCPPAAAPDHRGFGSLVIRDLVAEQLGAEVDLDFRPDGLALRYGFAIPAPTEPGEHARRMAGAPGERGSRAARSEARVDLSGRRVLVVEDEYLIAADLARRLVQRGAEVIGPAARLAEAEAAAESGRFDLAILDMNLGGQSTAPLARRLRADGTSLLFCSGYSAESLSFDGLDDVPRIGKPVTDVALDAALAQALPEGAADPE